MATGRTSKKREHAQRILGLLSEQHPEAHCELDHRSPFQLLVATVLSAQSTDKLVNKVTPVLFKRYPDPKALSKAPLEKVETVLSSQGLGMYRQKSKSITKLALQLVEAHGGQVPETLPELVALAGVGRKTANLVLGVCFEKSEGVVVDTHVLRVSQRLGLTKKTTPEEVEADLCKVLDQTQFDRASHAIIFHGRRVCDARKPACHACLASDACPSAFDAVNVGRKAPMPRPTSKRKAAPTTSKRTAKKRKP